MTIKNILKMRSAIKAIVKKQLNLNPAHKPHLLKRILKPFSEYYNIERYKPLCNKSKDKFKIKLVVLARILPRDSLALLTRHFPILKCKILPI